MQADTAGRLWTTLLSARRLRVLSIFSVLHGTLETTLGRTMFLRCVSCINERLQCGI